MSAEFPRTSVPSVAKPFRFQWEEAQECFVLLYPEGMVKLNPAAGEILKRCDGERTVGEIISELEEQFAVPDLADDVLEFFVEADGKGWIAT
ncbi:MAG: pyrroloquinoline quinone biosynthesis peptide chaperone PqqD [Gammaproteobacteria bacterium]|nr:pyrroloquinoline quinone biosynthesis peptide chaperone PqqD [Gammaproteobacteria bacterium]